MTRAEIKDRIRHGQPTPGIDRDLFESAYAEVLREDHPGSRIVTLLESRTSGSGLPEGVHARVAAMLSASQGKRDHVKRLTEAQSDLKPDSLFDIRDADTIGNLLRAAAERFKQSDHPDAVTARARNLDDAPKPFRPHPVRTLQEQVAAERLPDGIHAFVASRLGGGTWSTRGGR